MFKKNYQRKSKHVFYVQWLFLFRKSYRLWDMWKNAVLPGRPQMTKWHMRIACCIPKATNTHSGCVILIAFPLQQWLKEYASMLRWNKNCWQKLSISEKSKSSSCSFYMKQNVTVRIKWKFFFKQWYLIWYDKDWDSNDKQDSIISHLSTILCIYAHNYSHLVLDT
jgi:hypothetical protein